MGGVGGTIIKVDEANWFSFLNQSPILALNQQYNRSNSVGE